MAKDRKCLVCGKQYEWCNTCRSFDHSKRWKATYCSEDCKEIFDICSRYVGHSISKEDAYNRLTKTNINNINKQISIKQVSEEILSYKPIKAVKAKPKTEEIKAVETLQSVIEETQPTVTEEVEQPTYRSRRRRKKRNIEE